MERSSDEDSMVLAWDEYTEHKTCDCVELWSGREAVLQIGVEGWSVSDAG